MKEIEKNKNPYQLIRTVTPEECHWLERIYEVGEIVYRYYGATYNCIGKNGSAFSKVINKIPFFELPNDAVLPIE